jgi:hypothetical protein
VPFTANGFKRRGLNGKPAFPRSATTDWSTPEDLYKALDAEFHFDMDPCPIQSAEDGLLPLFSDWRGRRVYVNCPYGPAIRKWIERALQAEPELAVFLIPARTDTRVFHDLILPNASEVRFLRGRLKFGGMKTGAPFPSMVVVFRQ